MFEFFFGFVAGVFFATKVDCSLFVDSCHLIAKNMLKRTQSQQSKLEKS